MVWATERLTDTRQYKIPLAIQVALPVAFGLLTLIAVESPHWYVKNDRLEAARHTLMSIRNNKTDLVEAELALIQAALYEDATRQAAVRFWDILKPAHLKRTLTAGALLPLGQVGGQILVLTVRSPRLPSYTLICRFNTGMHIPEPYPGLPWHILKHLFFLLLWAGLTVHDTDKQCAVFNRVIGTKRRREPFRDYYNHLVPYVPWHNRGPYFSRLSRSQARCGCWLLNPLHPRYDCWRAWCSRPYNKEPEARISRGIRHLRLLQCCLISIVVSLPLMIGAWLENTVFGHMLRFLSTKIISTSN